MAKSLVGRYGDLLIQDKPRVCKFLCFLKVLPTRLWWLPAFFSLSTYRG